MIGRTSPYWAIASQVIEYSVDTGRQTKIRHEGKDLAEISEEVFLNDLYVRRLDDDFDEVLVQGMLYSQPVVCLVGSRGCGKTSALCYARKQVAVREPLWRVIQIDIKALFYQAGFQNLDSTTAAASLRTAIREYVMGELFPASDVPRFLAWLLAGGPDESEPFDGRLVRDLYDVSTRFLSEAQALQGTRDQRWRDLFAWLGNDETRCGRILDSIATRLRTAHVLLAATRMLENINKIILIYDNVDRLPASVQPAFMELINDDQIPLGGICTTVIAIRKENIRAIQPRSGAGGDYLVFIGPLREQFPAVLLPETRGAHVKSVLERRHDFITSVHTKHFFDKQHQDEATAALQVHNAVVAEFLDESIQALANNSVRTIVAVYSAFTDYLLGLQRQGHITIGDLLADSDGSGGHMKTLFYLWIRKDGHNHDIMLYDIHKGFDLIDTTDFAGRASEHHLLLTCVLNMEPAEPIAAAVGDFPSLESVIDQMEALGFQRLTVVAALRALCAAPGDSPKLLELVDREGLNGDLDELLTARLRLTPLGRELVLEVFSKVGYIWGLAEGWIRKVQGGPKGYFNWDRAGRMRVIYDYLVHRGGLHLRLMVLLRERWKHLEKDWLSAYRHRFGVRSRVQVERLMESCAKFFDTAFAKRENAFDFLLEEYHTALQRIVSGEDVDELQVEKVEYGRRLLTDSEVQTRGVRPRASVNRR